MKSWQLLIVSPKKDLQSTDSINSNEFLISYFFFPFDFRLKDPENWIVLLGAHELSGSRNDAQLSIKVVKIKIHEKYNPNTYVTIATLSIDSICCTQISWEFIF
jgi:hypothetical protein